jgi:hypothetical protein
MTAASRSWVIQDLVFDGSSAPAGSNIGAVSVQGTDLLSIDGCRFVGPLLRAVELHASPKATVRNCVFSGATGSDVLLMGRTGCRASGDTETPCWSEGGGAPAVFRNGLTPRFGSTDGCDAARLDHTTHVTQSDGFPSAAIRVADSDGVVLARAALDGRRPRRFIWKEGFLTTALTIKDAYLSSPGSAQWPLISVQSRGMVVVDGAVVATRDERPDFFLDVAGAARGAETVIVLEDMPVLPETVLFRAAASIDPPSWSFVDVDASTSPLAPSRWMGAVPQRVIASSARELVLPAESTTDLDMPGRRVGRIWYDAPDFKYCCGFDSYDAGRLDNPTERTLESGP